MNTKVESFGHSGQGTIVVHGWMGTTPTITAVNCKTINVAQLKNIPTVAGGEIVVTLYTPDNLQYHFNFSDAVKAKDFLVELTLGMKS